MPDLLKSEKDYMENFRKRQIQLITRDEEVQRMIEDRKTLEIFYVKEKSINEKM